MRPATKDGGNGFGSGYGISPEQKTKRWGRRGQRRSSATETLLGRRRWPQPQRSRRRKQGGEALVKKMAMAAFLGDGGGGQRWERWWAWTGEVEGFLAFDGSGGSRETEKRGGAGEGGHGGRGGGLDDERTWSRGRSEGEEGGAVEEETATGVRRDRGDEEEKGEKGDGGGRRRVPWSSALTQR